MKPFLKLLLLLFIPLALVTGYALSTPDIGWGDFELEKADLSALTRLYSPSSSEGDEALPSSASFEPESQLANAEVPDSVALDTVAIALGGDTVRCVGGESIDKDTLPQVALAPHPVRVAEPDSTRLRIMIFGDSMLEWMVKRLCDYTMESGYDLSSVIWYSSSTKLWAETDTLQYFLDRIRPDYVLLCLGSNELFVRDLQKRERYIRAIVDRISTHPFVWISPPNWKPDSGINDLIVQVVGAGRYFDSRSLDLERASDNVHPNKEAAAYWADTICSWLGSPACRQPLPLAQPTEQRRRHYHSYVLKPVH